MVPLIKDDKIIGVLDIDSPSLSRFSPEDEVELVEFSKTLLKHI